ncbi:ATP-grasp domain-containing protein [Nonomuraea sp. CA-141351]|uniref:ATP-grasp domain-containing protein n=1 Tax=Nonomuraea sp. CA-141351 TaxID=3239996 RepID=UPI003D93FC5F
MAHQQRVAILSLPDDLHALMIQDQLLSKDIDCHIVETSRLYKGGLCWTSHGEAGHTIPTSTGELLDVQEINLVWYRRINYPQEIPDTGREPIQTEIVDNEYKATLFGLLATGFTGKWINDPFASVGAENKLIQLMAAKRAGLRIPRTLVTHDPARVRKFCEALDYEVVVKTVKGSARRPLYAIKATEELVAAEDSIRFAPAIYQELVPGTAHIRAHCFGDATHAFEIESASLDWRGNLNVPIKPVALDDRTVAGLQEVLRILGLRMGIFDLKRVGTEEYAWLEVNPQGQFLFLEGLTGERLSVAFTNFLVDELKPAR